MSEETKTSAAETEHTSGAPVPPVSERPLPQGEKAAAELLDKSNAALDPKAAKPEISNTNAEEIAAASKVRTVTLNFPREVIFTVSSKGRSGQLVHKRIRCPQGVVELPADIVYPFEKERSKLHPWLEANKVGVYEPSTKSLPAPDSDK